MGALTDTLPDELILQILDHVPSDDLVCTVQRLSSRFRALSLEPRLWLARCRADYAFWSKEKKQLLDAAGTLGGRELSEAGDYGRATGGPGRGRGLAARGLVGKGPWRQMWLDRRAADALTGARFEKILASKVHRVRHTEAICRQGVEAKDYLVKQYRKTDGEDILARRYYADLCISSINRGIAVEEWTHVNSDFLGFPNLERGLAAFDMFVLHDGDEDIDTVGHMLDQRVAEFCAATPGLDTMTVRQKAMALLHWVRARDLVGLHEPEVNYRNLRNCLISYALSDYRGDGSGGKHPSLPIVSCAIYIALAQRLGLQAYCCTIPGHVHTTVLAPPGETLDGARLEAPQPGQPLYMPTDRDARDVWWDARRRNLPLPELPLEHMQPFAPGYIPTTPPNTLPEQMHRYAIPDNDSRMFLDPYGSDEEVSLMTLRQSLAAMDWGLRIQNELYLYPAATTSLILRMALNLEACFHDVYLRMGRREEILMLHQRELLRPLGVVRSQQNGLLIHRQLRQHLHDMLEIQESDSDEEEDHQSSEEEQGGHPDERRDGHQDGYRGEGPMPRLLTPSNTDVSPRGQRFRRGHMYGNLEALAYATAWAEVLMRPVQGDTWYVRLEALLSRFAHSFGEDAWIVDKYLVPLYDKAEQRRRGPVFHGGFHIEHLQHVQHDLHHQERRLRNAMTDPRAIVKMVHNLDARQPLVSRRYTQDICEQVQYRVGQVFRHKRFLYVGIINGWELDSSSNREDGEAEEQEDGPARHSGPNGHSGDDPSKRKTVYYTSLQARELKKVVKQDNIEIVTDPRMVSQELIAVAGKNFKRFDPETCTFVSNIREFFPDD